ncbi:MAG: peptidoglycan DD-metalloendopeptidase family protein [Gammaproteobacteria bacterium]|nr:peptidoglycan DD-metalloendopeptidase family protein [Gammaproteobacteria bacterium]
MTAARGATWLAASWLTAASWSAAVCWPAALTWAMAGVGALALGGCASTITDYEPRVHVVQPGETLFNIAWRYRLDHRQLARWNFIPDPDLIFVGQRIRLYPPPGAVSGSARTASAARSPSSAGSGSSAAGSRGNARAAPPRPPPAPVLPAPAWRWPTSGPVVSTFGSNAGIPTGIGIGGREGQAVEAAAAGRVVYAGSGLIGYGQLVIIQHNDTYLTAYGHNRRLLVDQGQTVASGQRIAEMGLGPEREPRLHFEIRRNGTPIDPLQYLSARR